MSSSRKAALAIGVGSAPPLPYLGGAVNGARAFHEWAIALGYESRLITDESGDVTIDNLRDELEALLPAEGTHRLLVYFAGHGVINELEQGLWLLSDWSSSLRAVTMEGLRRRLATYYNVSQIALFADACRVLTTEVKTRDLEASYVLGLGHDERASAVAVDKFIAALDGTETYMIPGEDPEDDRCLFSGVLLEGLWGTRPGAFSKLLPNRVTSQSLASYLQAELPVLAKRYAFNVEPTVVPTFPEDDAVYFGDGPAVEVPEFPPWPTAEELAARRPGAISGTRDAAEAVGASRGAQLAEALEQQERPYGFASGAGFAIDGDEVVAIWAPDRITAKPEGHPGWWSLTDTEPSWLDRPAQVLIELATGRFAALAAMPLFIATGLVDDDSGVVALVYREVNCRPDAASATEAALARLEGGGIRADEALSLAVDLRHGKHKDPVRGILAAYLYDTVGDVDSIRRMAWAYTEHEQAIPYDIALLGQMSGRLRPDGLLEATVPPVPRREPRTPAEAAVDWSHAATPEAVGVVGGLWPWLRQGWAFLDEPSADGATLVLPGLEALAESLAPARFTTFHNAAGLRSAELFALSRTERG